LEKYEEKGEKTLVFRDAFLYNGRIHTERRRVCKLWLSVLALPASDGVSNNVYLVFATPFSRDLRSIFAAPLR